VGERSKPFQVAIIGSGFAGLAVAWHLKQKGVDSFTVLEKASDVGGVWRENTYPGAASDVASHLYSFSFAQQYPWKHRFSEQPQILDYLRHCTRELGLESRLRYGAEVLSADFDAARSLWTSQAWMTFPARCFTPRAGTTVTI
jgi:cation diffusion facilitator CzcD-associated flavoprotein CzcO